MEKYSRGWRGAPAKGVGRSRGARVQIPLSPFSCQYSKWKCWKLSTSKFFASVVKAVKQKLRGTHKFKFMRWQIFGFSVIIKIHREKQSGSGGKEIQKVWKKSWHRIKHMILYQSCVWTRQNNFRSRERKRTLTNKQQCNPENSKWVSPKGQGSEKGPTALKKIQKQVSNRNEPKTVNTSKLHSQLTWRLMIS